MEDEEELDADVEDDGDDEFSGLVDSTGELLSLEHVNSICSEIVNSSRCCFLMIFVSRKSELSLFLALIGAPMPPDLGCLTAAVLTLTGMVDVDNEQQAESSSLRKEFDRQQPESDEPDRSCCGDDDE